MYLVPVQNQFEELSLSPTLLGVVESLGYSKPTPIQDAAIPVLLEGRDFIGQSKTGSGKTAAFALPILQGIDMQQRVVQALVLCPTRELSAQVAREVRKLGRAHPGLTIVELVGGQPAKGQREALERGEHIVVGTPGRLLDFMLRSILDSSAIKTVVLDEADRMLDMGFGEDVRRIMNGLPRTRQTSLFSATFPESIEAISRSYQRNPFRVTIEDTEEELGDIKQAQVATEHGGEMQALCWVLRQHPHESALVFCNLKASVSKLTNTLASAGLSVDRFDGDLDQFHRDQVLARFRNHSVRILIATDVAGRGLDVKDLDLVVNYELPSQSEVYVHRIGRTGRAGKQGVAVSLARGSKDRRIQQLEEHTGQQIAPLDRNPKNDPGLKTLMKELAGPASMATILISGGRKDRVRPGDLVGALTGEAGGLSGGQVGKIEVQERLSYVAVARSVAREAVACLNSGRIKGKRFRATLVGESPRG